MCVARERIDGCVALSSLSEPARETVAEIGRSATYETGERIVPLGQPPQCLLVLTEGLAKRVGYSSHGSERVLALYRPNDLLGVEVLLDDPERDDEIVAMTPIQAIAIGRRDLDVAVRNHPEILHAVAREVSRHLEEMTERIVYTTGSDVPVRLAKLLLEFAAPASDGYGYVPLTFSLTHELMAQIVGASRPHTSTVLGDLEGAGALLRRSPRGLIVRPDRLKQILDGGGIAARAA